MKKLALSIASVALLAAPAFACPNMEEKADKPAETAPITAQKDKKADPPKKAEQPKADAKKDDKKPADTAKAKDTGAKKPDKVSQR